MSYPREFHQDHFKLSEPYILKQMQIQDHQGPRDAVLLSTSVHKHEVHVWVAGQVCE